MKKINQSGLTAAALLFFSFSFYVPAQAQPQESYYPYSYARISYLQGEARVERASDLGVEAAEVNFALGSGDKIVTENGLVELSFGRENFLRLDRYSALEIARLPQDENGDFSFHLYQGRAYLRINYLEQEKSFSVHTGDASFYVLQSGLYRFEAEESEGTIAIALEGSLEASGENQSLALQAGESGLASDGEVEPGATDLAYVNDELAGWNQERDGLLQMAESSNSYYLPEEIREYEPELSSYGSWVYERPYGYVWVPAVTVVNWRPYLVGRWTWYPRIGWTWISAEPWGWAVYHYGRWHWRMGLGWYWIPMVHWGPAWVSWYYDANYVGWCPLSYYNRPVVVINNYVYERYNEAYYPVNSRALVMVKRNQLQSPHAVRAEVRPSELRGVEKIRLQERQPSWRPAAGNRLQPSSLSSPEKVSGKTVRELGSVSRTGLKATVRQPSSLAVGSAQGKTVINSRQNSNFPSRIEPERRIVKSQATSRSYQSSSQIVRQPARAERVSQERIEVQRISPSRTSSSGSRGSITRPSSQAQVKTVNNNHRTEPTGRSLPPDRLKNTTSTSTSSSGTRTSTVQRQPARPENKKG